MSEALAKPKEENRRGTAEKNSTGQDTVGSAITEPLKEGEAAER